MQPLETTNEGITQRYAIAVDALYEIGRTYYANGRFADAQHLLHTSLQLLEAREGQPQQRLKLLLIYGQVLAVKHLLTRRDADLLFATILQAKQIAEETQDQQGVADALSLLGQAHYFTTIVAGLKRGEPLDGPRGQGKYEEALAYQQQALELREALRDTRGISESYFQIGVVYERWQQYEQALEYYTKARQVADQYGHLFEKTEPARHFALHALRKGDLDQALPLALQAVSLREAANFKPYLPLDHLLLRSVYLAKGDEANAQLHTEIATALAEEMGMKSLVSSLPDIRTLMVTQRE